MGKIEGRTRKWINLAGEGEVQYLFPRGNADPHLDKDALNIDFSAEKPFGTDTLTVTENFSHLEDLCVASLDFLGRFLDAGWIVLHQLDLGELAPTRFLLGLRVHRVLAGEVDQ